MTILSLLLTIMKLIFEAAGIVAIMMVIYKLFTDVFGPWTGKRAKG